MHGFSVIISKKSENHFPGFNWKKPFGFQPELIKRNFSFKGVFVEQFTLKPLINEKLWIETDTFFIVTEGIITNLSNLCEKYKACSYETLLSEMVKEDHFFNKFTGHFAGFLYFKKTGDCIAFNNHSGSKKLFYFNNSNYILFGNDLFTINSALKDLKINTSHDIEAAYLLLTCGFMLGNKTLINEISQISAGEYIKLENGIIKNRKYFDLQDIITNNDAYHEIIDKTEYLFKKSVTTEFNVLKQYDFISATTLSGGLDSRVTALIANNLSYKQELINFSERAYADDIIAKQIADHFHLKLNTVYLEPKSLLNIDEVVLVNDGLTIYTGSSHVFHAFKNLTLNNIGIVHTGMIGDAVLGSFLTSKEENKPKNTMGLYSKRLFYKTSKIITQYISNYKNEEMYKFYTRAFSGANNGFLFYDLKGESSSPFLEPEFMSYAISIPGKYRYNAKFYIDWIKKLHPEFANFTWENSGGKPTNNPVLRNYYRYKRAVVKRLPIKSMWKNNMNPEQIWYDYNPEVKLFLDTYFENHLHYAEFNRELLEDLKIMYNTGSITEKSQVLTLLAAYKLLF